MPEPVVPKDRWLLHQHKGGGLLAWGAHTAAQRAQKSGFSLLVLCAEELQDRSRRIEKTGVRVFRWGFDDDWKLAESKEFRRSAIKAGLVISKAVLRGHRVLVTCHMGMNRSGLVAASAYRQLTEKPGVQILDDMRALRSDVLSNTGFRALVESWL